MNKTVILTLKQIKYIGKSIGNDIRVEVEALNGVIALEKKIQKGSGVDSTTEIGQIVTDKKSLTIPTVIRVIEQDLLFNDVGSSKKNLKINLDTSDPQSIVFEIPIAESRGYMTGKIAHFEVTIEAQVFQGMIRYVEETKDGWLNVKPERGREDIALPKYLRLLLHRTDSKREYFTILEGVLSGKKASVELENKKSHLSLKNPHTEVVQMTYSIAKKILKFQGKSYKTVDYPRSPWKKGFYDIEIPDHSHEGGHNYPDTQFATTWFRIGHSGDRYLHTGTRSAGCVTLIEQKKWAQLYEILVKARKGDGMSIGTLAVID